MPVTKASISDHEKIAQIARANKYTTGFTNMMYSGEENYKKGWIGKFVDPTDKIIKGFICLRHAVRKEMTVVYDVGVHPHYRGMGAGRMLIEWAMEASPYGIIQLNVDDTNVDAMKFYRRLGFRKCGVGSWKNGNTYTTFKVTKDRLK